MKKLAATLTLALATAFSHSASADIVFSWEDNIDGWKNTDASTQIESVSDFGEGADTLLKMTDFSGNYYYNTFGIEYALTGSELSSFKDYLDTSSSFSFEVWSAVDFSGSFALVFEMDSNGVGNQWNKYNTYTEFSANQANLFTLDIENAFWADISSGSQLNVEILFQANDRSMDEPIYLGNFQLDGSSTLGPAIPEPKTYALLVGLLAIGAVCFRRYRNR